MKMKFLEKMACLLYCMFVTKRLFWIAVDREAKTNRICRCTSKQAQLFWWIRECKAWMSSLLILDLSRLWIFSSGLNWFICLLFWHYHFAFVNVQWPCFLHSVWSLIQDMSCLLVFVLFCFLFFVVFFILKMDPKIY